MAASDTERDGLVTEKTSPDRDKKSSQMYLFLLKPQNMIIQDHKQGEEKQNESQIMKEENTGTKAEAKRQEDMNPKINLQRDIMCLLASYV